MRARERLERPAALDQDAPAGGLRGARDEGHGRGENERTGRRRDEHSEPADRISRKCPGRPGDGEGHRQQDQGEAIRHPDEGRFGGLRRRHHFHDAGIGALACRGRRADFEGLAGVDGAAARRLAGGTRDGDRLARDRRLVERRAACDDAIDRDDLAGAHEQPCRPRRPFSIGMSSKRSPVLRWAILGARSMRDLRSRSARATAKSSSTAPPAYMTATTIAARLHGEQGRRHGEQGDRIDAHPAGPEIADDRDGETGDDGDRARRPQAMRQFGAPGHFRGEAAGQAEQRDHDQRAPGSPLVDHWHELAFSGATVDPLIDAIAA